METAGGKVLNRPSHELAATPGFGRIYICGNCDCVHFSVGPVSLTLTPPAYLQMVDMVNRSAANFEYFMAGRGYEESGKPSEHFPGKLTNDF